MLLSRNKLIEIRSCFRSIEGINEIKKLINLSKNIHDHPVILAYNYTETNDVRLFE